MAPDFRIVAEHVARNPVARAVARRNLMEAVRDFSIRLHLLHDGEFVAADVQASAHVLAVATRVCADTGTDDTPHARVMAAGMHCLEQLAQRRFLWRVRDAVAVEQALAHAVEVYSQATALQVRSAWLRVREIERQEGMRSWA